MNDYFILKLNYGNDDAGYYAGTDYDEDGEEVTLVTQNNDDAISFTLSALGRAVEDILGFDDDLVSLEVVKC
jgi:hypothetical protein